MPILYLRFIQTGSTSTTTLSGTTGTGGARSAARGRPGARHEGPAKRGRAAEGRRDRALMQGVRMYAVSSPKFPFSHARSLLAVYIRYPVSGLLQRKPLLPCTVALEVQLRTALSPTLSLQGRGSLVRGNEGRRIQPPSTSSGRTVEERLGRAGTRATDERKKRGQQT